MAFNCYIDESGDEGIGTGGSRWFILGSMIVDDKIDLQTSNVIPRIKTTLNKPPLKPLHWSDVRNHDKKLGAYPLITCKSAIPTKYSKKERKEFHKLFLKYLKITFPNVKPQEINKNDS